MGKTKESKNLILNEKEVSLVMDTLVSNEDVNLYQRVVNGEKLYNLALKLQGSSEEEEEEEPEDQPEEPKDKPKITKSERKKALKALQKDDEDDDEDWDDEEDS